MRAGLRLLGPVTRVGPNALPTKQTHIAQSCVPHAIPRGLAPLIVPRQGGGEHRPQRPTESSDPTQHAKGRTGDRPGPRKGATTRRNVTQGGHTEWGRSCLSCQCVHITPAHGAVVSGATLDGGGGEGRVLERMTCVDCAIRCPSEPKGKILTGTTVKGTGPQGRTVGSGGEPSAPKPGARFGAKGKAAAAEAAEARMQALMDANAQRDA